MKKVILLALALAAGSAIAPAQSKLDPSAAQFLSMTPDIQSRAADDEAEKVAVIVTMTDNGVLSQIEELGGEVLSQIADMAIVSLSAQQIEAVAAMPEVKRISLGYSNHKHMDTARALTNVDKVQAGTGLDKAYDGTGVICGIMDIGLDVNHANFLDAAGKPRTSALWVIQGRNASVREYLTPEAIQNYTTDRYDETHGTHVLGIMAGGYKGKADVVATVNPRNGGCYQRSDYDVPYYGVATGAELAPCSGTLDGNNILIAAERIMKYAEEQGKPAVMNLSLGHNRGPHDGTTAADRFLAEVGKKMLITVSSGNEGSTPMSIRKKFAAGDTSVKTFISEDGKVMGVCDIWSEDNTPFKVTFSAVDTISDKTIYTYSVDVTQTGTIGVEGLAMNYKGCVRDFALDSIFTSQSYVIFTNELNPENNRYNSLVTVLLQGKAKNVKPVITVEGKEGKTIDMYADQGVYFLDSNMAGKGYVEGDDTQSINDMACGDNILCVGAYTNKEKWPTFSGFLKYIAESHTGDIADFSSYGKTFDGRPLPHVAAPGQAIIASYNNYYFAADNDPHEGRYVVALRQDKTRDHQWMEMSGTSMAAPLAGGILALWLQADPTLTMDRVKEIIAETAIKDKYTEAAPEKFGYGKIDALAGLKKILGMSAVNNVTAESDILVNQIADGRFDIFAPGASAIEARIYSLTGALAASVNATGENATVETDGTAPGIYVLSVTADGRTQTRKIVVR